MSINHAILGLLSASPLSGYDLKKIMQDSPFMYWSGNNNQIYKALLELHSQGYVTNEVMHQDNSPTKKIYTITEAGLCELKRWIQTVPEAPEYKNPFLVQLAWADLLAADELEALLRAYEQKVQEMLAFVQGICKKGAFAPDRTARETTLWASIDESISLAYESELNWTQKLRQAASAFSEPEPGKACEMQKDANEICREEDEMTYQIIEKNQIKYILLDGNGKLLQSEQDGLELISLCAAHDATRLLIYGERLSEAFLRLRTGVAGAILQKLTNYGIKTAVVYDESQAKGTFKAFLSEANAGKMFRTYSHHEDAERWLLV